MGGRFGQELSRWQPNPPAGLRRMEGFPRAALGCARGPMGTPKKTLHYERGAYYIVYFFRVVSSSESSASTVKGYVQGRPRMLLIEVQAIAASVQHAASSAASLYCQCQCPTQHVVLLVSCAVPNNCSQDSVLRRRDRISKSRHGCDNFL